MVSYNTLLSDFNHILAREDGFMLNRACNRKQHELLDVQFDDKKNEVIATPYTITAYTFDIREPFWYRVPGYGYFSNDNIEGNNTPAHYTRFFRDLCYFWLNNDQQDALYLAIQTNISQSLSLNWRNRRDNFDFQKHLYIYSDATDFSKMISPEHSGIYFKNLKMPTFAGTYNIFDSCCTSTATGLYYIPWYSSAYNCMIDYDLTYRAGMSDVCICERSGIVYNCEIDIHGDTPDYLQYITLGTMDVLCNCKINFDIKKRIPIIRGGTCTALIGIDLDVPAPSEQGRMAGLFYAEIIKNCRLSLDIDLGESTGLGSYNSTEYLASCKKLIDSKISLKLRCCLVLQTNKTDYWGSYPDVRYLNVAACLVEDETINSQNNLDFEYSIKIVNSSNSAYVNAWYKIWIYRNGVEYYREIQAQGGVITSDTGEIKP